MSTCMSFRTSYKHPVYNFLTVPSVSVVASSTPAVQYPIVSQPALTLGLTLPSQTSTVPQTPQSSSIQTSSSKPVAFVVS